MKNEKLRTFSNFPKDKICPICKTSKNKECFLVPIIGTEEGNIAEAIVVHTGCLALFFDKDLNIIYQKTK